MTAFFSVHFGLHLCGHSLLFYCCVVHIVCTLGGSTHRCPPVHVYTCIESCAVVLVACFHHLTPVFCMSSECVFVAFLTICVWYFDCLFTYRLLLESPSGRALVLVQRLPGNLVEPNTRLFAVRCSSCVIQSSGCI